MGVVLTIDHELINDPVFQEGKSAMPGGFLQVA
jgi:hypothetical protein